MSSELDSAKSISKEQKDEINKLTVTIETLTSEKHELETQVTSLSDTSTELDNKMKEREAEKVGIVGLTNVFELTDVQSLAVFVDHTVG